MLKDQEHIFYLVGFDLGVTTSPPTANPQSFFVVLVLFIDYNIIILYVLFISIIHKYNNILYLIYYYLYMNQAA